MNAYKLFKALVHYFPIVLVLPLFLLILPSVLAQILPLSAS